MDVQKDPEGNETKFLHAYAEPAGKLILEIGAGEGRLTWRHAASARRVTGIDLDRDGLRVATIERPSDMENAVAFVQADAGHLPFASEAFDMAILAWSF
jgi:ubiquinone/menaquinone biosynthesis C-methylase UbiE